MTNTRALKKWLKATLHTAPHAISFLIIVAHASEIAKVVDHISWTQGFLAAFLLGLWLSAKPNLEAES